MQGEYRGRQRGGLIQRARAGAGLGAVGTVAGGAAADADGVDVAGRSEHGEFLLVPADGASGLARTRAARQRRRGEASLRRGCDGAPTGRRWVCGR